MIKCKRAKSGYWIHYDKSGNECRQLVALQRVTSRVDGLKCWLLIVGPWSVRWT